MNFFIKGIRRIFCAPGMNGGIDDSSRQNEMEQFLSNLKESGMVIDDAPLLEEAEEEWRPIPARGKPLSQEILEDRR